MLVFAPAPLPWLRSPEEDQALLIQGGAAIVLDDDGDYWMAPPVEMIYEAVKQKCTPILILTAPGSNVVPQFKGREKFHRPGSVTGTLLYGVIPAKGGESVGATAYRLDREGGRAWFVVPDGEGGEIRFAYELDKDRFKLSGGKKLGSRTAGFLDIARVYKRPNRKK
jgi:hypothetical protein